MPYTDPERRREYGRAWMKRNPERARDAMRRWRAAHRELDRERRRASYAADPHTTVERVRQYQKQHPEVVVAARQRRRGREHGRGSDFTPAFTSKEWTALVRQHAGRCAYCGCAGRVEPDHRTPLSRGGQNTIDNILPACRPCNQRKYTSSEREFRVRLANERLRSSEFVVVDWWPAGEIQWVA